jgi:YVTN family beta-propeller protein
MTRPRPVGWVAALALLAVTVAGAAMPLAPVALAARRDGATLYVAESAARQIAVLDAAAGRIVSAYPLPCSPSDLVLDAGETRLLVTGGEGDGRLLVLAADTGKTLAAIACGHSPVAPIPTPDGRLAFVCDRFANAVVVVDLAANAVAARVPVGREPIAACLTPDGRFLFVANHLPSGAANEDYIAARVEVVDVAQRKVVAVIRLPDGSTSLRDIRISPDGRHVFVTHILARYQVPTTQLDRGWMNTNALTILDANERKVIQSVLLDDLDRGAANPWGVACSPDGRFLCVAHAGTHELSVVDLPGLLDKVGKVAAGQPVPTYSQAERTEVIPADQVSNSLTFLLGLRRRVALAGNGPRAVAIAAGRAFVAERFSDTLAAVDLTAADTPVAVRSFALGPKPEATAADRGERLFNDAALCFQQWQSCASCHPDGRTDGLNWDLLNDGFGNPKNTKNMLLAHRTPPSMAMGVRDRAEVAVRAGIKFIQFAVRPEQEAADIDEYLKALAPVPSPRLVGGKLNPAAERGAKVFVAAGCAACHPSPLFTDLKSYDVGTGRGPETGKPLDTPTLVEVWRTAPYLYDGRAHDMRDCLTTHNADDKHGATSKLTPAELGDLIEYVLSL